MTGLSEVREKLERAKGMLEGDLGRGKVYRIATFGVLSEQDRGFLMNLDDTLNLVHGGISEAIALMESEQGEQMRRDHEAMDVLREKPGDLMWFGMSDNSPPWHSYVRNQMTENQPSRKRPAHDPTDAILGTESENGGDDD